MKKLFIILSCIIVVGIGAGFSYQKYIQNKKAESEAIMKKDIKKYNNVVLNFYNDSQSVYNTSSDILDDYSNFWNIGLGTGNMFKFVNTAKTINESKANEANSTMQSTSKNLKLISEAANKYPDKFKEIYSECKKLYSINSALLEQVKEPTGSYITFNQSKNELGQQFDSEKSLLETLLP
jgi:hypothetical protein